MEKTINQHNILRKMKDNCDFVRSLTKIIGQIRDDKMFIDTSIKKIMDELEEKTKETEELSKINKALEELNVAIESEFQESKSQLRQRIKHISKIEGNNKFIINKKILIEIIKHIKKECMYL